MVVLLHPPLLLSTTIAVALAFSCWLMHKDEMSDCRTSLILKPRAIDEVFTRTTPFDLSETRDRPVETW